MTFLTEIRERFLLALVARVPAERIAEIHFFAPIRQGGIESGVAVVAAWPENPGISRVPAEGGRVQAASDDRTLPDEATAEQVEETDSDEVPRLPLAASRAPLERPVVYTARYRLTLKGPDRGKWETSIVAEADAPLVTVDAVVRGVQRRAGDVEDPTRMEGEDLRALLETAKRAPVSP